MRAIAKQADDVVIAGLCRASVNDINRAWEALQYAYAAFTLHFDLTRAHEIQAAHGARGGAGGDPQVGFHAASLTSDVEWSPEDGTRTDRFLVKWSPL